MKYSKIVFIFVIQILLIYCIKAQSIATIDITGNSNTEILDKKFGGYTPEKVLWVDQIYDSTKTLGPLNLKFHRFQLDVNKQSADGTWIDEYNSQVWILKRMQKNGCTNFVTINTHPNVKNDTTKMRNFFTSIANALVNASNGKTIYLELFGEPDLSIWNWYTGYTTFDKFYSEFKFAVKCIDPIRKLHSNLKLGGCGFAWAGTTNDKWYKQFIDSIIYDNIDIDFVSYHHYYEWNDNLYLSESNHNSAINRFENAKVTFDKYASLKNAPPEFIISEFSWAYGDLNTSIQNCSSFKNYRNCARALETMFQMGLDSLKGVDKIFWAQSVGQYIEGWGESYEFWTFFPFVNWHFFRSGETYYTYNAAYYAFWFYGQMKGKRIPISFSNDNFLGLASSENDTIYLVLWNRSPKDTTLSVQFNGLTGNLNDYNIISYSVDNNSFSENNQFPTSLLVNKSDNTIPLQFSPEGSIFLKIWKNENQNLEIPNSENSILKIKFANPAFENDLFIYLFGINSPTVIKLISLDGKIIRENLINSDGYIKWTNLKTLNNGVYLIYIQNKEEKKLYKLIIMH